MHAQTFLQTANCLIHLRHGVLQLKRGLHTFGPWYGDIASGAPPTQGMQLPTSHTTNRQTLRQHNANPPSPRPGALLRARGCGALRAAGAAALHLRARRPVLRPAHADGQGRLIAGLPLNATVSACPRTVLYVRCINSQWAGDSRGLCQVLHAVAQVCPCLVCP